MIRALDIIQDITRLMSWPVPSTIEGDLDTMDKKTRKILTSLNIVGQLLGSHYYWRWLYKEGTLRTIAEYTTGDADVTQGSNVVTSDASPAWTSEMEGREFKLSSYQEVYTIKRVVGLSTINLEELVNASTRTDQSYTIFQRRYPLPEDFDSELGFMQFISPRTIRLVDPINWNARLFGSQVSSVIGSTSTVSTGKAIEATIQPTARDGRLELVLDPPPDTAFVIKFNYYALLPKLYFNNDAWPFSVKFEPTIIDGTIHLLRHHAQDDQARSAMALQKFFQERSELAGLQRPTDIFARFQPDTGTRRTRRARRRISTGRYDLGDLFDRVW